MLKAIAAREINGLVPFVVLALGSLALMRPAPPAQKPSHDTRIVVDADGLEVPIEIPFRGVAFTWCGGGAGGYLGVTHSPQTLANAGSGRDRESFKRTLLGWIFPDVVARDSLWDGKVYDAHGGLKSHYAELRVADGVQPVLPLSEPAAESALCPPCAASGFPCSPR